MVHARNGTPDNETLGDAWCGASAAMHQRAISCAAGTAAQESRIHHRGRTHQAPLPARHLTPSTLTPAQSARDERECWSFSDEKGTYTWTLSGG